MSSASPSATRVAKKWAQAGGDVRMTVTYSESGGGGGTHLSGTYKSIREAMDALRAGTPGMDAMDWELGRDGIGGTIDLANGEVDFDVTLTHKGRKFPKSALNKAFMYLRTGNEDLSPTLMGDTLSIPGRRGTITITPGNSKAWFQWTVARDGKATSVSRGSTDDGVAEDAIRRGLDPTWVEEANGILQVLTRETGLSENQLSKIWNHIYKGSFRGMKTSALKVALDGKLGAVESDSIYPNKIDHGYKDPISGGSDVMQDLVQDLRHEQGQSKLAWILQEEGVRVASKKTTLSADLRLKDGTVFTKGSQAEVHFGRDPAISEVEVLGRRIKMRTVRLHKYLRGFPKPPSIRQLQKWDSWASGPTVTGVRNVEMDGHGPDGSPSWMLAMELI